MQSLRCNHRLCPLDSSRSDPQPAGRGLHIYRAPVGWQTASVRLVMHTETMLALRIDYGCIGPTITAWRGAQDSHTAGERLERANRVNCGRFKNITHETCNIKGKGEVVVVAAPQSKLAVCSAFDGQLGTQG